MGDLMAQGKVGSLDFVLVSLCPGPWGPETPTPKLSYGPREHNVKLLVKPSSPHFLYEGKLRPKRMQ